MKSHLKRKRLILLMTMEILKTTVGHALNQLFPENVAFTIASFLVEDPHDKMQTYKLMCEKLYGKR